MEIPRYRLTTRRWMVIVLACALLLGVVTQVVERKRREAVFKARAAELRLKILANKMAQVEINALIESERRRHPEDEGAILKSGRVNQQHIRDEGKRLRRELSGLRP